MKSKLEDAVSNALRRSGLEILYEPCDVEVTIVMQTKPDLFVPSAKTIVEIKGTAKHHAEFAKLVATSKVVREGVEHDGVLYNRYVVAVQLSAEELASYAKALCNINALVKTTQRGSFPLVGLRLLAALQRANVQAVPVTYGNTTALRNLLDKTPRYPVNTTPKATR